MALVDIKQAISDRLHGIQRVSSTNRLVTSFIYGFDNRKQKLVSPDNKLITADLGEIKENEKEVTISQ